jgi:DNA-binding NarL/FixJ family response regulator/signal transduction histidine kinase
MTQNDGASDEVNWGAIGLLGHLEHDHRATGGEASAADPFSTREGQLDRLLSATGEVVGGELKPELALRRLSEAASRFIAHDLVDIGWLEGDSTFCSLQQIAALPEEERPGELETIERSGLASVLVDGQPLLIDDLQSESWRAQLSPKKARQALQAGSRAAVIVPMRLGQRITGMLEFQHREPGIYRRADVETALRVADQIAPVVEALHLYKREELVRRQLETVFEISQALSASLEIEETLPVLGRSLTRALALPTCAIYLYDEARRALVPRAAYGSHDEMEKKDEQPIEDVEAIRRAFFQYVFPIDEPFGAHLSQQRQPLVIDNPREFPDIPPEFVRDIAFVAVMEVPLVVRDRLVGIACLPVWEEGQGFTERQLRLAMGIAQAAAVAIEHAQLYARARELGMAEERNRLAREVHDTLAQGLTAITLQLEAAERLMPPGAEAKRLVGEARTLARRSLAEARRAVWGLAPSPLDGRSLAEALADEVAGFGRRTGLAATFSARGEIPTLPGEHAAAILRVVQEALHNVEKHAKASRVRVELEHSEAGGSAQVSFLVADDGLGFDPGDPRAAGDGGFGLTSMQERMRLVGGRLDVESAPGWGARVRGHLALDGKRRAASPEQPRPAAAEPIRVLLVDDHPLAREGIRRLLNGRDDVVVMGEAEDGVEGVERSLALRPDVILMDLQMPRLSGVGAIQALREQWSDARVLILTTFAQDEHLFEALRAGARGYLLKDAGPDELAAAIKTVHEGGSLVQPVMASRLLDRFGELATRERLPEALTEREVEVLRLVASGARNREIAEQLVVSEKTVKYHLGQAYAKLTVTGRTEAVARARELGLLPLDTLSPA